MTDVAELGLKVHSDDVDKANKRLDQMAGRAGVAEVAVQKLTVAALKLVAAYASWQVAGAVIGKFVSATIEAEQAQRRLETVIRSTGGAAGYTADELAKMASGFQQVTTYGDETVKNAQAVLLTFTKIGREVFPQALEASMNLATALNMDLQSAILQVGKAVNDPILGMTALSRAGIQFTESQKETIKTLVATGEAAKAQKIILGELETQFGGMAREARGTLGGALQALQNAFDDLFEANGPASEQLRVEIEKLVDKLTSPATIAAVQSFGTTLIKAFSDALPVILEIIEKVGRFIQILSAGSSDFYLKNVRDHGDNATKYLTEQLNKGNRAPGERAFGPGGFDDFFRPFVQDDLGDGAGSFSGLRQQMGLDNPASGISSKEVGDELERQADAYDKLVLSAQGRIDQLKLEAETTGLSTFEAARLEEQQRLLESAAKSGIELGPDQVEQLNNLAVAYANAAVAAEGAQVEMQNKTAWETTADQIESLNELLAAGAISWETYGRAVSTTMASHVAGTLGSLANLASGLSSAFEDVKALSVATAVLKGAESIASAYAEGMKYFGLPGAIAYAGIAAVTAAANVATVLNTSKSSKSISGGSGAGSGAPTVPQATEGRGLTIVLNGDRNTPTTFQKIEDIATGLNDYYSSQGKAINIVYKGA